MLIDFVNSKKISPKLYQYNTTYSDFWGLWMIIKPQSTTIDIQSYAIDARSQAIETRLNVI